MPILSQQQERQKRKKAKDQSGVSGNKKEQQQESSNGSKSKKSKSGNEDAGKKTVVGNGIIPAASSRRLQSSPITSGSVGSKKNIPTSTTQNAVRSSLTAVLDTGTGKDQNKSTAEQQLTTPSNCHQVQYSTMSPVLSSAGDLPSLPGVPKAILQNGGRGSEETSLVTETNSAIYVSALYTNEHRDLKKEIADRLTQLKEYVRNDLFPYWKFFSSKKQMVFSNKQGGIVLKICNDLNVPSSHHMYWWETNKKAVLDALNRKRNDVTSYLKKRFCCKLYTCDLPGFSFSIPAHIFVHNCVQQLYTVATLI